MSQNTNEKIGLVRDAGGVVLQEYDAFLRAVSSRQRSRISSRELEENRKTFAAINRKAGAGLGIMNEEMEERTDALADTSKPLVTFGDQSFFGKKFRRMEKIIIGALLQTQGVAVSVGDDPLDYVRDNEMLGIVIPNPMSKEGFRWMKLASGDRLVTVGSLPLPSRNGIVSAFEEIRGNYKNIMSEMERLGEKDLRGSKDLVIERVDSLGIEMQGLRNRAYSQRGGLAHLALLQQSAFLQKMQISIPTYSYGQGELMEMFQPVLERLVKNRMQIFPGQEWVPFTVISNCGSKIGLNIVEENNSAGTIKGKCEKCAEEVNSSIALGNPDLDGMKNGYSGMAVDKYSRYVALQNSLGVDGYIVGRGGITYMPAVVTASQREGLEPIAPILVSDLKLRYTGPAQELASLRPTRASKVVEIMSAAGDFSMLDAAISLGDMRNILGLCGRKIVEEKIPLDGDITINKKFAR